MGMSGGSPGGGIKSEINVTPLVDVVLVLLIIFMVVTPMLQRGKDVSLPKAQKPEGERKDQNALVLSVTPDKRMYLEQDEYDEAALEKKLAQELGPNGTRRILLKGDEQLTYGDVRKVVNIARRAGAKGISLGVQEVKAP
ncbi:MAG TPA: biopolymer transporter ExbD [Myxococcaceae bacterium]|nr:biopolymer transporter ExbD [Myxococcaceae bacterium]